MKVNSFQNINIYNKENSNVSKQKDTKSLLVEKNSASNKIAFYGLFNKKPIDATMISSPCFMKNNEEYSIMPNAKFMFGQYEFNLNNEYMLNKLGRLKPKEKLYIGKQDLGLPVSANTVADKQLCIKKTETGGLVATSVSKNSPTWIMPNVVKLEKTEENFILESEKFYELPLNSKLNLGGFVLEFSKYNNIFSQMKNGERLVFGRGDNVNVKLDFDVVSRKHLMVQKYNDKFYVKDLNSLNKTEFVGLSKQKIELNKIKETQDIITLPKGVATKVPSDSQVYLGGDFVIDLRNKNILDLLYKKGTIVVGRSKSADLVVPDTYSKVSRNHLNISLHNNEIYVTDMNSTNNTQVIPKDKIKPFYEGVENIEFLQGNIGDCYLLVNLYALSRNHVGRFYLENMVKVDDNGNYVVQFHNRDPISVPLEQLDGQRMGDQEKRCVSGDLAIRAIERAYGKMLNEEQDYGKTLFMQIDRGGQIENALRDLTGVQGKFYHVPDTDIEKTLNKLGPNLMNEYLFMCSTPENVKYGEFADSQCRFIKKHAYAIKNIDMQNKMIEIVNPHNTKQTQFISFCEFSEIFNFLHVVEM